jgi:RHS repeat-associated protein
MPMPGKQIVGGELYRYAYQGQEKDPETGKEAFQLRLWDGRIGRWLTTDPAGQYASPYLGMGNDPMNGIDPDGAFFGPPTQWIGNDGEVIYDDDIDNGTVYFANEGYEFNGNLDELTANSTLMTKDFKIVATDFIRFEKYILLQLGKGEDFLSESMFTGGITFFGTRGGNNSMIIGGINYAESGDGRRFYGLSKQPLNPRLSIVYNPEGTAYMFSNVYNIRNVFEHESKHFYDALGRVFVAPMIFESSKAFHLHSENAAIDYQQSTKTWKSTSENFKNSNYDYRQYVNKKYGN